MPGKVTCGLPGTISHEEARAVFNAVRKENPKLTPATHRREAARRMGTDYDTYLAAWKKPGAVVRSSPKVGEVLPQLATTNYDGDTPVSEEVGKILDKWVTLRGSGTLTAEERVVLKDGIDEFGEELPRVYRGVNEPGTAAQVMGKYEKGKRVTFDAVSTSEEIGAALPYAESGDGVPVVFTMSQHGIPKRGLKVANRAEATQGFAEEEWITKGTFEVILSGYNRSVGYHWAVLRGV